MKILVLPGDHIGQEVTREAVRCLETILDLRRSSYPAYRNLSLDYALIGGAAMDAAGGDPLPRETRVKIQSKETIAILFGAIGGPEWADSDRRPEEAILQLRKDLDAFVNVRPCRFPAESLKQQSALKLPLVQSVDFIVLRELCSGIYFGKKVEYLGLKESGSASDVMEYRVGEIQRVARVAGQMAREHFERTRSSDRPRVTSVDKANVLATSRLWRRVVTQVFETEFPDVDLRHQLVDSAAMQLIKNPSSFNGILLTSNLFGDILSDEASVIVGSLGLLPSASMNGWPHSENPAVYEPIHGSAPDISGKNMANPVGAILSVAMLLRYSLKWTVESDILEDAVRTVLEDTHLGGYGYRTADIGGSVTTQEMGRKICEVLRERLADLNVKEFNARSPQPLPMPVFSDLKPAMKRPMNLCEKILYHHTIGFDKPYVQPGDMICCRVDWTLASELTWKGMEKTYDLMKRPGIWRNDRFWLAIDHTVDPSINDQPKPRQLIQASERFAKEVGLRDFHGPNQTILHTEFYRERAQPGMLIIGADSHSCSAGGLGNFAVGLGAADVLLPLVTGETWFRVPETVNIRFVGEPPFGIGGKDVILWVLGELKRNTVAFERAVEYTGPGCQYLSCDARFAIANMTTEFGGIAGVFAADEITAAYIEKRKNEEHKREAIYFRADDGAQYSATYEIDLSRVDSMVALYPSPDNVVPISHLEGMKLDGVFIGACTTAEEDLILGALVLEQGLKQGLRPSIHGKRKVTPGSASILAKLRRLGLLDIYQQAGFELGAPGCSYCLGIAADRAGEGEVWLSSQNRNFKHRMGKGSIGNLASAASVAASSFDMRVENPRSLLDAVDHERFHQLLQDSSLEVAVDETTPSLDITEPCPISPTTSSPAAQLPSPPPRLQTQIRGRVQKFGDHVDTDAIIPAEFMPGTSDVDLGTHCFQYVRPSFRQRVREGATIVVAGAGFGSGSSREEAPRALLGCGVQCVIARSFAFIYGRNQFNMALLGIIPDEADAFYQLVEEDMDISIDVAQRVITVHTESGERSFSFQLSLMEERLIGGAGVQSLYDTYGHDLFRVLMLPDCGDHGADAPIPHHKAMESKTSLISSLDKDDQHESTSIQNALMQQSQGRPLNEKSNEKCASSKSDLTW